MVVGYHAPETNSHPQKCTSHSLVPDFAVLAGGRGGKGSENEKDLEEGE
jgi:hypothetical protein